MLLQWLNSERSEKLTESLSANPITFVMVDHDDNNNLCSHTDIESWTLHSLKFESKLTHAN